MNSYFSGQSNSAIHLCWPIAIANGDHRLHSRLARASYHFLTVSFEPFSIEMCVRIYKHWFRSSESSQTLAILQMTIEVSECIMHVRDRTLNCTGREQLINHSRFFILKYCSWNSFQSRPHRHIFQKACQHRLPAFQRRCHDHPVRLHSAQLPRRKIGYNHHFSSDQRFRRIGFGDSGQYLPYLGPDVDLQPQQFVCLRNPLGNFHQPHAQFNFREVIDGYFARLPVLTGKAVPVGETFDAGAIAGVATCAGSAMAAGLCSSSIVCILSIALLSARGKTGCTATQLRSQL